MRDNETESLKNQTILKTFLVGFNPNSSLRTAQRDEK